MAKHLEEEKRAQEGKDRFEALIQLVTSQTTLSREEAIKTLREQDGDAVRVIKDAAAAGK